MLHASATECVNFTSTWTMTDLVYHFTQQVNNLVSQMKPSAHEQKIKIDAVKKAKFAFSVKLQLSVLT